MGVLTSDEDARMGGYEDPAAEGEVESWAGDVGPGYVQEGLNSEGVGNQ